MRARIRFKGHNGLPVGTVIDVTEQDLVAFSDRLELVIEQETAKPVETTTTPTRGRRRKNDSNDE